MYKRIDIDVSQVIEGFSYANVHGNIESVVFEYDMVTLQDSDSAMSTVYIKDIPKLIKALQSAYDYYKGDK